MFDSSSENFWCQLINHNLHPFFFNNKALHLPPLESSCGLLQPPLGTTAPQTGKEVCEFASFWVIGACKPPCFHCCVTTIPASGFAWGLGWERGEKGKKEKEKRKYGDFSYCLWILGDPLPVPQVRTRGKVLECSQQHTLPDLGNCKSGQVNTKMENKIKPLLCATSDSVLPQSACYKLLLRVLK